MATTTVSDAVVIPQAKGTGLASEDDNVDAAGEMLLSEHVSKEHLRDPRNDLQFTGHDGTNDQIDVTAGVAYVVDDSTSTGGSRGAGGNPQIQSTSSSGYDTEVPVDPVYMVVLPTDVTNIDVSSATLNDVWLNITDVTSNNAVEIRTSGGGGTTSAPSDTFIKLGQVNPDDASADQRAMETHPPGKWSPAANTPSLPNNISGTTNTYTFDERPKKVKVVMEIEHASGGSAPRLDMTVNNVSTSNYAHVTGGGSQTTGDTKWPQIFRLSSAVVNVEQRKEIELYCGDDGMVSVESTSNFDFPGTTVDKGSLVVDTAPINQFTLTETQSEPSNTAQIEVYVQRIEGTI